MANNQNNKGSSGGMKAAGMGLAALAAAAAGAYYFYGNKNAAKNRKALRGWVVKAKGEVMERMEGMKDLTQDGYNKVVTQVMDKYKKVKNIDPAEIAALTADMRNVWKRLSKEVTGGNPKRTPARKPAAKTKAK